MEIWLSMHSGCYDRCFVENFCANEEVVFMNFPYMYTVYFVVVAAFLLYLIIISFIIIAIVFDFKIIQ